MFILFINRKILNLIAKLKGNTIFVLFKNETVPLSEISKKKKWSLLDEIKTSNF